MVLENDGVPEEKYWAFQPYEDADLSGYVFGSSYEEIEKEFIDQSMECIDLEPWDEVGDKMLMEIAKEVIRASSLPAEQT